MSPIPQLTCDAPARIDRRQRQTEMRTQWVAALSLVTMVTEIIVGHYSHSLALTTEGWHQGTHVGSLEFRPLRIGARAGMGIDFRLDRASSSHSLRTQMPLFWP